jgi:N-acetylneuraminate synthase
MTEVPWGEDKPCYIVAEIGLNHNGSLDTAKKLIDAAVDAGANAVKFQKRTVDVVYTAEELARPRESPFGETNGDLKRGLEFGFEDYQAIDGYCYARNQDGITWFASPWDVESVKFLEQFDVPFYKVASACVTDYELLKAIDETGKPVIVSTGMSSNIEIEKACECALAHVNLAILVCTATYPSALKDLRLERIREMKYRYPECPIGWSHHAVSPWPALCAAVLGAKIIECHLTLDRSSWGSDQSASLEPAAFKKLITEIRDWEIARGDGTIGMIESERPIMEKLRRFR